MSTCRLSHMNAIKIGTEHKRGLSLNKIGYNIYILVLLA